MAQVSYGTITITDTTDIEDIFLIYKGSNSDTTAPSIVWSGSTNDWKTDITQVTGDYIWAITVFKYTGITITSTNYTDYYSSPICLTGEPGTSVTITSITYSTLTTETQPGNDTFTLTAPPTVAEGGWLWSRVLFSNNQSVYSKAKQGQTGQRGTSILKVTTAPSATSGTISGFTYSYRMSLSTVKTQSGKSEVIVGDVVEYNSNHYRVGYVDSTYVYLSAATSIKGADGQTYYTWIKYAPNNNPTDAQISDNPTNMTYIGIYTGTITPAPSTASSYAPWMKYIGTNGSPGSPGVSVTGTRELYYLKTNNTNPSQITNSNQITATDRQNGWTSIVPTYVANGTYYTCIETSLSTGGPVWSAPIENKGLTNANAKALDAYNTSTARDTEINAIQAQAKHYWWDSQGAHVAAGANTTDVNNITQGTPSTYGFNSLMSPGALKLKYQDVDFAQLATNSLTFYRPATSGSTYVQGKKAMDLTADALTFYKPLAYNSSNEPTAAAQLTSNGLKISDGIIQLGTNDSSSTSNGCITLSNTDFTRLISGTSRSSLRLAIGQYFGVKNDGTLYASNAEISGKITASSLTIGSGATVSGLSTSNISGIDNYALQSDLNTEIAQRKAVYAVSTTGATTAAKTTESGTPSGFVLYNGATVTIKFNSANSTTTPTLNVNGTGAKTIKSYTGAALTAAEYTWPAGAAITFTYDGSYWRMQDGGALQAKADAAASASSASSSASAASSSASSASTSASNASSSATSASNSASTASTKATEASNSASTASAKASAASTSATNAANSASAASTSATNASNSADAAASSASDASDSADAAAGSASTASSKATAASNSATAASNSASSASSSATSASNSASSASSSATTATNKANAASESATNAANSATAASGSATSAANSATAASNSATSASNSATAASNSATAAAEVMGGFTILWNYSAFGTSTAGDAFICGFDPATGTKSDANGWIKWNGTKRTITKQQVNPGTIVPYNIPIYIVCRLSSATATTGTNYMVWYNAGWKYAACPSPTAVGGSWTWTDNRDIILGSFVETGANEVLTECELFNPPWTSKQITTNTTTPTSYIMDTDSNKGITVKPKDSSGNDFLQMNSTAIEFFRNSTTASAMRLTDNSFRLGLEASNHTTIDTNGLHIWVGTESTATNEVALFSSTARIGKTNNSRFLLNADSLQAYNSSNTKYFEVSANGMTYGSNTVASETYANDKANAAKTAAKAAAQDYANTAEANASYSVEIEVSSIDFVNNNATLIAHPYFKGVKLTSSTTPALSTITGYSWSRADGTAIPSGVTTNAKTLQLPNNSDLSATYVCMISKA